MTLAEHRPGRRCRIQLTGELDRCSAVWTIVCARHAADVYIIPLMLGGTVKVSLHQSGSWQVGLTKENATHLSSQDSRHWDIWQGGWELAPGIVRAWYLLIPDQELRVGTHHHKAYKLPPVGQGHATSIEVLIMPNVGQPVVIDDANLVGRLLLAGRAESCLVVARRIPWTSEQQAWANAARQQALAQAEAAGLPNRQELRYYFHGNNAQGVRFGLELAGN